MGQVYSTAQAAKLAGISEGTVRNYVRFPQYAGYFSEGANPPAGQPRQLTEADLTLLAYIREKTAAGVPHDQVAAQIAAGELAGFTWSVPEAAPQDAAAGDHWDVNPAAGQGQTAALALGQPWVDLLNTTLQGAQAREAALTDRLIAAESARARAEGQLEAAQAQLAELKAAQGRGIFRRLFGG